MKTWWDCRKIECRDEASDDERKCVRNDPSNGQQRRADWQIHTRRFIHTYTFACTTKNNNNSENNTKPHAGSYIFTRCSFTVAWRASAPLSLISSSLWSTLCLRRSCFIPMLIASRSCVRTCRRVLSNCPKILILSFRDTTTQTIDATRQQYDYDRNNRNDNDEGLAALHDNTDNTAGARSVKSLQGVVQGPTLWKSVTDVLTETATREMATKPTAFVLHH